MVEEIANFCVLLVGSAPRADRGGRGATALPSFAIATTPTPTTRIGRHLTATFEKWVFDVRAPPGMCQLVQAGVADFEVCWLCHIHTIDAYERDE